MADKKIPMRVSIITMDTHLSSATERARYALKKKLPSLELSIHAASSWTVDATALENCITDIESADILIVTMLFMEDHYKPVIEALKQIDDRFFVANSAKVLQAQFCKRLQDSRTNTEPVHIAAHQ